MRILVTSDLHYTLRQYDWLLRVAADFDAVIIAGDCLDIASTVDGRTQIVVVLKYLQRVAAKTRLMVCSGNHDLCSRDASGERVANWLKELRSTATPVDGDAILLDGVLFSVFPWWDGPRTIERIAEQLSRDALRQREHWIWIYHAPPTGARIAVESDRVTGDDELTRWIARFRPDLVFCGHVHNAPFLPGGAWIDRLGSTIVTNAGRQTGDVPAHIVIDTEKPAALWLSIAGAESARLDVAGDIQVAKVTDASEQVRGLSLDRDPIRV